MARPEQPRARLVWLLDGEVQFNPHAGPNRVAADGLVGHVRSTGVLAEVDEAHVMAAVMLAEAVDADPTNAALWGQYRAALDVVKGAGASGDDDAFTRLMAELGGAPVRHSAEPEPGDEGYADRERRGGAQAAVDAASAVDRRRRRGAAT